MFRLMLGSGKPEHAAEFAGMCQSQYTVEWEVI
jgi:hypothetical protein